MMKRALSLLLALVLCVGLLPVQVLADSCECVCECTENCANVPMPDRTWCDHCKEGYACNLAAPAGDGGDGEGDGNGETLVCECTTNCDNAETKGCAFCKVEGNTCGVKVPENGSNEEQIVGYTTDSVEVTATAAYNGEVVTEVPVDAEVTITATYPGAEVGATLTLYVNYGSSGRDSYPMTQDETDPTKFTCTFTALEKYIDGEYVTSFILNGADWYIGGEVYLKVLDPNPYNDAIHFKPLGVVPYGEGNTGDVVQGETFCFKIESNDYANIENLKSAPTAVFQYLYGGDPIPAKVAYDEKAGAYLITGTIKETGTYHCILTVEHNENGTNKVIPYTASQVLYVKPNPAWEIEVSNLSGETVFTGEPIFFKIAFTGNRVVTLGDAYNVSAKCVDADGKETVLTPVLVEESLK